MLSHDEDRSLKAIERYFEESDPAFTRMLRNYEAPEKSRRRTTARVTVYLLGGVLFLTGAAAATAALMVLGILVLTAGVCWHLASHT